MYSYPSAKKNLDKKRPRNFLTKLNLFQLIGALAQLGERMTGSHEVSGSIPLCSTKVSGGLCTNRLFFCAVISTPILFESEPIIIA